MADLSITDSFRSYRATLKNHMWAYSAVADDGAIVISFWSHHLKLKDRVLTYTDKLSRWKSNKLGQALFVEHLAAARDHELPIRLVIATAERPELVDQDADATKIKKTYATKPEVAGHVVHFDGDNIRIEFRRNDA
jgi:hypothetical protein